MHLAQPNNPAEVYEQYFVPAMFRPWTDVLLRHAGLLMERRLLDVACGTGVVARRASPLIGPSGSVVAIDINAAMLAVARSLNMPPTPKICWCEGSAMDLPFEDGAFDVVLCQHGLPFFPDRPLAVREMHRVLASEGRAIAIVLQALEQHPIFEALMKSVAHQLALPLSAVAIPFALFDAEELKTLFIAAGFEDVQIFSESIEVRFAQPELFVQLAVVSSAAAVPAFAHLDMPHRAALLDTVREEVEPIVQKYRDTEAIVFPMFANVAVAHK